MTPRQVLRRLVQRVIQRISQGDTAPPENEAVRIVRLLLRRYELARLLERATLDDAIRQASASTARFSSEQDQQTYGRIAARTSADVATVAGRVETSIEREVRRAFHRSGGVSTADLQRVLRPLEIRSRVQAYTIATTAAGAYDRAARLADAEDAGVERFRYAGPPADRPFCQARLKEAREGVTYTLEEIRRLSNGQGLPVELYCGGYNCRHQWLPVFIEEPASRPRAASPPEPPEADESISVEPINLRPDDRKPMGKAVSLATKGPSRGELKKHLGRATTVIDGVHGDGVLPTVPVQRGRSGSRYGAYEFGRDGSGYAPTRITLDLDDHPEMTLAHEIGHFLDQQGIPGSGKMGMASHVPSGVLGKWRAAVEASPEYKAAVKAKDDAEFGWQRRIAEYYLEPHELWARSYAQYVATRSGDETMRGQLNNLRTGSYSYKQWSDESFEPIAAAIDDAFETLGWIQKK